MMIRIVTNSVGILGNAIIYCIFNVSTSPLICVNKKTHIYWGVWK